MRFALLLIPALLLTACGGRHPSAAVTTRVIRGHFNAYGKEYKESPFGGRKVARVEILDTEELHKGLVEVTAFVTIEGPEVFKVRMFIEKGPFGWRYVSWENLG